MPAKVTMTLGAPASGKSTWAKEQVALDETGMTKRVNKDDLRMMLDLGEYSTENEHFVIKVRNFIVQRAIANGLHIIVDDCNLNPKNIRDIRKIAGPNVPVEIKSFLHVPLEELIARNEARRANPLEVAVPKVVIEGMLSEWDKKWSKMSNEVEVGPEAEPAGWNPILPSCIIVDLDGTLAHNNHGRSFYDFSAVDKDDVDEVVKDLVNMYFDKVDVIIFSGRDDSCFDITEKWLAENDIRFNAMYMRVTGDRRNDAIVKRELFEAHIRNEYNVECVIDDRDQVVRMWREDLGLKVLQVAYGDF